MIVVVVVVVVDSMIVDAVKIDVVEEAMLVVVGAFGIVA